MARDQQLGSFCEITSSEWSTQGDQQQCFGFGGDLTNYSTKRRNCISSFFFMGVLLSKIENCICCFGQCSEGLRGCSAWVIRVPSCACTPCIGAAPGMKPRVLQARQHASVLPIHCPSGAAGEEDVELQLCIMPVMGWGHLNRLRKSTRLAMKWHDCRRPDFYSSQVKKSKKKKSITTFMCKDGTKPFTYFPQSCFDLLTQ